MPKTAKLVSRTLEFDKFHKLEIVVAEPDSLKKNGAACAIQREVFRCGKAALVLMYLPETDQVLMSEQFRMGAFMAEAENPFLLECAGGIVDDGETPEQTAIREACEETGCNVTDIEFIGNFYPSPGCLDEEFFLYCGRIQTAQDGGVFGNEDEEEEIKTHLIDVSTLKEMMAKNDIKHGMTAIAMLWFFAHHDRLRQKWTTGKGQDAA